MESLDIRDKVIEEIKLIPEHRLREVYNLIHYFRLGVQNASSNADQIMKFAGCWQDMPENVFNEFLEEIEQRRQQAFSRRRGDEASLG